MLREAYTLAALNSKKVRDKQPNKRTKHLPKFKVNDLILLKNYKKQNWVMKIYAYLLYL